jgi:hypothetical protein
MNAPEFGRVRADLVDLTRTGGDAGSCAQRGAGPVRMSCRAGGLTLRASSNPLPGQRVHVRFERGDRDVGADRAAQGFVTRWWWRVPAGNFGPVAGSL